MNKYLDKIRELFEKYNLLFLIPVIVLYVHSRYKYLGEICYYMHVKELQTAYDSFSAARFASWYGILSDPSPLFAFLSAVLFKLKGGLFSLKLFRLLQAAGGLFGMIFSYLAVWEAKGRKSSAFFAAVLWTTLPAFFIPQRTGMGDYVFIDLVPALFWFIFLIIKTGDPKKKKLFTAGFSAALFLMFFTTGIAPAVILLFLLALVFYLYITKKTGIKEFLLPFIVAAVSLVLCIALFHTAAGVFSIRALPSNIINIKSIVWDDGHPYNISSTFGTIYAFSVPVMIAGVVVSAKKALISFKTKTYEPEAVLWIYTIICIICALFTKDADLLNTVPLMFSALLLLVEGIVYIADNLKGAYVIALVAYVLCFWLFTHYYFENFNSEVNNSSDHENGIIVDKSVGEAVKAAMNVFPQTDIAVITDDFAGRNLMIALFASSSPEEYAAFSNEEFFSSGSIKVCPADDISDEIPVYIIEQAAHQDVVDALTAQGWGNLYLKEYTIVYRQ